MNAPLYKFGAFGDEASLVVAFLIGIGFGWFLERAGFGNARKLMAQFYLTDMAVFKVMFTAIVTAMVGLFYLSWAGFVDLSLVYLTPTFLWPQILGGLLLGFGFVIGGYCPGTSVVALSTGKVDALIYGGGILAGILVFGEAYPAITGFVHSSQRVQFTIPQLFNLPYGLVLFAVVLMALGGFLGATAVEKMLARKASES